MDSRRPRRIFALVALVLAAAPLAASSALFDPDEGLHAAIAQEMNLRRDYVTPTFLGEPFLDKPILFFWTEAASLRVFGSHEDAVRIPPIVFALLSMVGVAALGRTLFGAAAGFIAGIAYATMLLPLAVGEIAVHDVALAPFICGAAIALAKIPDRRAFWLWSATAGVCLGLSILTKGLVGLAFVGLFVLCLGATRPRDAVRLGLALVCAVVLAVVIAAPWYVAMERAHPGYLHYYFIDRHVRGFLTATQLHAGRPWWYYAPILVAAALPWTGYAMGAARYAPRERMLRVVWEWLAAGFVFLSLAQSKLGIYALPLFIPLALVVGDYIVREVRQWDIRRPRSGAFAAWFALHALVLAALPALGLTAMFVHFGARSAGWLWAVAGIAAALIGLTGARGWRARSASGVLDAYGWMTSMAIVALAGVVAPRAANWMTARDLAAALDASGTLPPYVAVLDERIGSLVFYLSPALRREAAPDRFADLSAVEALARIRRTSPDAILAVRDDQLARFTRLFSFPPAVHARAGTFTIYRFGDLRAALAQP